MNNFEQRLLVSYLSKLINVIDLRSYAFDDLFDFFLKSFKIKKKFFSKRIYTNFLKKYFFSRK